MALASVAAGMLGKMIVGRTSSEAAKGMGKKRVEYKLLVAGSPLAAQAARKFQIFVSPSWFRCLFTQLSPSPNIPPATQAKAKRI